MNGMRTMTKNEAVRFARSVIAGATRVVPLSSNKLDRHWNFKVRTPEGDALLRVENPTAVAQRRMRLADEAKIVKFFGDHGVAQRLLRSGRVGGRRFMVEEWVVGRHLPKRLSRENLKGILDFFARMNAIPPKRLSGVRLERDRLDVTKKRLRSRLRSGNAIPAFRPLVREAAPIVENGFAALEKKLSVIPKAAFARPVFYYRDIGSSNILITKRGYIAIDWEPHSVGLGHPAFSLVVLMRRFRLGAAERMFVIREYEKRRKAPYLREMVDFYMLERALGEATWGFDWLARRKRLGLPVTSRDIREMVRSIKRLEK